MAKKDICSLRSTLEFFKEQGWLLTVTKEVDPIYEISGILKSFDNGPTAFFENIKGYPNARNVGNLFARRERVAQMFDVSDPKRMKFKAIEAIKNPIPPVEVNKAPCQEVVIAQNIDVMAILPILKHTEYDGGRIIGGGNTLVTGKYINNGSHLSFNRTNFQGKDWATLNTGLPSELALIRLRDYREDKIPITLNIGTPPAVMAVAGGGMMHAIIPYGSDELGIAGALQGSPVEICKAKTVDAYAVANSEWVLEGYYLPERVWETEEAAKVGKTKIVPFFPEWTGYMGKAWKAPKFQVTGITHRADRPIFYSPLAHSFEGEILSMDLREACFYEMAQRIYHGLVVDVHILDGMKSFGGIVFQMRKRGHVDEGFQRQILLGALASSPGLRMAIAVDEDIDIYNAEEIIWALCTRTEWDRGVMKFSPPAAREKFGQELVQPGAAGGVAIDATIPVDFKENFKRPHHPVDRIELKKWFSQTEIDSIEGIQSDYARLLANRGW